MSNGDDDAADAPEDGAEAEALEDVTLDERLADVETALEEETVGEAEIDAALDAAGDGLSLAETETDLDRVEAALDDIESALEDADLPEPDDEDDEDPRDELESRLADLRDDLEDARGPYADDVVEALDDVAATIRDTRWTEDGRPDVEAAVAAFADSVNETLDADVTVRGDDPEALAETVEEASEEVVAADLDPDDDAETIAALVQASDALEADVEDAEEWDDLTTREQLAAEGYYDVLGHRKDYPPEWHALKVWEKRGNAEMVMLAYEKLGSEFMEEHCLEAIRRMGPEEALEPMLQRAGRRDQTAIEILGKIGSEEAVDTIVEYVGTDSDPQLERATLKTLGEIGSLEATQAVADRLVAENDAVRRVAARSLGLLGDERAVEPLSDVASNDEVSTVRAAAVWALVQIGTERALDAAAEYADDRAFLVQSEAQKAVEALGAQPA